jgi:acetylornithine deacetylase/succinyl-diaminopimelate desuccinylase-like protein
MTGERTFDRRAFLRRGGQAAALAAAGAVALPPLVRHLDGDRPGVAVAAGGTDPARPDQSGAADPADLDPVALTLAMIRFDTSHAGEGGVTLPHAEWLKSRWEAAGVPTEIIPTPKPDNVHFIARIPASAPAGAPPLLLLCHSDVVSVDRERWTVDPYAGVVQDGFIYGRGAIDMKGANAAFMAALLRHVSEGARFDREIIFVSDADEEAGPHGGRWLATNHWDRVAAGAVLTEGGWTLAGPDGVTPRLAAVTVQDRISATVELTTRAITTHSARPMPDGAIVRLNRAIVRLSAYEPDVFLTPSSREYFAALADAYAGDDPRFARALRLLLAAESRPQRNRAGAVVVKRSPYPWLHNAFMRPTLSYVIEQAGYRVNIIPGAAGAQVNVRLVPGGPPLDQIMEEMRAAVADPEVTLTLRPRAGLTLEETRVVIEKGRTSAPATTDTDVFAAWAGAVTETYPGARPAPCLFEAGTSGGPWREKGIPVYGIYPYAVDNDTMTRMHGNDERVGVEALKAGTELMYRLFSRFRV